MKKPTLVLTKKKLPTLQLTLRKGMTVPDPKVKMNKAGTRFAKATKKYA